MNFKRFQRPTVILSPALRAVSAGLYSHSAVVESDNFRKLLLTFAQDIRVIIIMIVDRLALMRAINHHPARHRRMKAEAVALQRTAAQNLRNGLAVAGTEKCAGGTLELPPQAQGSDKL